MSKKEAYLKKLQAQFDQWSLEIDKFKAKADQAEAGIKVKYHKNIEELRARQAKAKEKLAALKGAGDDAWEDLKSGIESAWEAMGKAIRSARAKFK
jgi:DNA repair ATPase RecN